MRFVAASSGILRGKKDKESQEDSVKAKKEEAELRDLDSAAGQRFSKEAREAKKRKLAEGVSAKGGGSGASKDEEKDLGAEYRKNKKKPISVKVKNFGSWEKHTKGFGARMLEKMAKMGGSGKFTGRLGKHEDGVAVPVITKLRPQGAGIGMIKERTDDEERSLAEAAEREQAKKALKDGSGATEEEKAEARARMANWKKSNEEKRGGKKKKHKRVYKTAAEVMEEEEEKTGKKAEPSLIVDMRGPQVKITSLDTLKEGGGVGEAWKPPTMAYTLLPELQHNGKFRLFVCVSNHYFLWTFSHVRVLFFQSSFWWI